MSILLRKNMVSSPFLVKNIGTGFPEREGLDGGNPKFYIFCTA